MDFDLPIIATALGLYLAGVVSPGPNFALVSRMAVSGAKQSAIGATLGLASASTLYAVLTMTGLALLLTQIGWLSAALQIAGGCYLIYLGLKAWVNGDSGTYGDTSRGVGSFWSGLQSGTIVNLANPKCIAFFVSLYAVAIPASATLSTKLAILAGGFLLEIIWYGLVITLLSTAPARSAFKRFGRWIERAVGTLLAGFGLRLIAEKL
ncbi:threonine transporter [Rhizobium deserti]|uniref:Threonine transporter n=1 Tax=Rhizobium deserti TaxID=2547961 RepID=A0A4R5U9H3_9HYPH|nr:LysE family transporter [Rhizobium deserti]TDK31265.1 threonine transporter [Rhizobium deserti]